MKLPINLIEKKKRTSVYKIDKRKLGMKKNTGIEKLKIRYLM